MKRNLTGLVIIFLGALVSILIIIQGVKKPPSSEFQEASFYQQLEGGKVQCELCPNRCLLANHQRGLCKARENIDGKLYSLVYGQTTATGVDPIEKKPFFHFLPGAKAYSLATTGCNLSCKYCQNWDISQRFPEDVTANPKTPPQVVDEAVASHSQVIAFTYNEPVVWYEYMFDIAKKAKEKGLQTVMVSNGYINPEPLKALLPYLDAIKIDFKSFDDETYVKLIGGKLEPVLNTIKLIHQSKTWLELVYLIVPGYTDDLEEIKNMCTWIKENVGDQVPVHFSRFGPKYKLTNLPPTPEETVKKARRVCLEVGLKYVYTGNIEDETGSTTYCPTNGQPLIKRQGYFVQENLVGSDGKAVSCPEVIPGAWQ